MAEKAPFSFSFEVPGGTKAQRVTIDSARELDPQKDRQKLIEIISQASGVSPEEADASVSEWAKGTAASKGPKIDVKELLGEMAFSGALEGGATAAGQALGAALPFPGGASLGGMAGAAVGNLANQYRRMYQGKQERWTPKLGELGTATAQGAIPGGFLTKTGGKVAKAAKGAGRDVVSNVSAGEISTRVDEDRAPTTGERVLGAGIGALGGGVGGALERRPRPALEDIRESVRASAAAKQRIADETGLPYTSTRQEVNPRVAGLEEEIQRREILGRLRDVSDQNYRAQSAVQERMAGGAPSESQLGERLRGYVGGQEVDPERVALIQSRMAERIAGAPANVGRSQLEASQNLGTKLQSWVDQTKAESQRLYGEAHQALRAVYGGNQDPTFYPKRTAKTAKELVSKLAPSDEARFRESVGILEDLDKGDLSIEQLRNKRSLIGSMIKGEAGELGAGIQKGQLDQLYKSLTQDLDEIFENLGPGIREKFDAANKHFRENIEKSNLYNIEKGLASPEGRQNMAKTIVSEITSGGESQSLNNIEKVLGRPDPELDGYLRDAILDRNFDRTAERLKLDGLYSDAYNVAKKNPALAARLGLGQGDSLARGRIALETFKGGKSVDMDSLQDTMRQLNLSPQDVLADTTAIRRMVEAQRIRDAARTDALVNVLNNTGTDLRKLTDPKGIYNSVFNGENTTVDQMGKIVTALEQRARGTTPDAAVADEILTGVRKRKLADFFNEVKSASGQSRAARAVSEAELAGRGTPELDPVKLQKLLEPSEANRKLEVLIGSERWSLLKDLVTAESANARAARTLQPGQTGGAAEYLRYRAGPVSLWISARAAIPFLANVFADPDVILTPAGRMRQKVLGNEWISMVGRRAAAPGTPENQALLEAIQSIGGVDGEGNLTPEGQNEYDRITSPSKQRN